MTGKILLVDDERDILSLLEEALRREGFRDIRTAENGAEAVAVCRDFAPDVVVLDIVLPDMDGFEVCRQLRQFSRASVLFLSSRNEEIDKLLGLAIGGDDYVTKPFSPKEMAYRVKAQVRRQAYAQNGAEADGDRTLRVGPLCIEVGAARVRKGTRELALTAREYGLLLLLAENRNRILSKERLYEQVWGEDSFGSDNTLMVHIRHLREKIEDDPSAPRLLVTVKGLGYKLVDEDAR